MCYLCRLMEIMPSLKRVGHLPHTRLSLRLFSEWKMIRFRTSSPVGKWLLEVAILYVALAF